MQPLPTAHVPAPELSVDADGQPFATAFGDVYFSRAGGAAETEHVFLRGNDLPARWAARPRFTIGELGFGTGLNFLVTWREFLRTTDAAQHLHFVSVEKYPLTPEMLGNIHNDLSSLRTQGSNAKSNNDDRWPEIPACAGMTKLLDALLAAYPLRLPGWHQMHLERCTLTLGFGDAAALLSSLTAAIDAWFIDGFSPAKNPDMWEASIFAQLARLSAADAGFATFTAAGAVKRQLQAHGFAVEKVKGFAHKRDMLVGRKINAASFPGSPPEGGSKKVIVIGAGIAGATVARALAERGWRVTVLERDAVACGASGNQAAVLYPQLTKFYTQATAWHFTGYGFTLRQIARWSAQGLSFSHAQPGMLRLPRPEQRAGDFASLQMDSAIMRYVTRDEAAALAGMAVASDGWWFPHGCWINPAALCRALLAHPNITLRTECDVQSLAPEASGKWRVESAHGETLIADRIVVATAHHAAALLPEYAMPLGVSAGQVSILPAQDVAANLNCIVSHRGYVIPMPEQCLLGATYDRADRSGAVTAANHAENLAHARAALPDWRADATRITGRTSFRATTPDRLPYVGEIARGLYVSIGHGSRGMISAPLAAEILAAQMLGEPIPLADDLRRALHPLRRNK